MGNDIGICGIVTAHGTIRYNVRATLFGEHLGLNIAIPVPAGSSSGKIDAGKHAIADEPMFCEIVIDRIGSVPQVSSIELRRNAAFNSENIARNFQSIGAKLPFAWNGAAAGVSVMTVSQISVRILRRVDTASFWDTNGSAAGRPSLVPILEISSHGHVTVGLLKPSNAYIYRSMQKSIDTEIPSMNEAAEDEKATKSRGRPREFDREAALAQATRLFWAKGYEATSIMDLTKAMGIGSPSLYAAFGSKEALYADAVRHYGENYEPLFWHNFQAASTAREAVESFLLDTAAVLSRGRDGISTGCMMALSSVGSEGSEQLNELLRSARAVGLERLEARIDRAFAEGEIPASVDRHALARYMQTVQGGMSILARDFATYAELKDVAETAMMAWDSLVADENGRAKTSKKRRK